MTPPETNVAPPLSPMPAEAAPPAPAEPAETFHIAIRPGQGNLRRQFHDLWLYRELFYFLVWRDIKVRYKQTVIGIAWVVLQPLCTMLAFWIFFGKLAKVPSDGIPYPLFAFAALLPWQLFAFSL